MACAAVAVVALASFVGAPPGGAQTPADVGELGPLIPFHKDAIHASLTPGNPPKICFWMRPSEYRGTDLVDPSVGDLGELRPVFDRLVYGGFGFSTGFNGLDESVTTRIKDDIPRDNGLCVDLGHPAAFANAGKTDVRQLNAADFALNAAAFSNAGDTGGLNYNIFCSGHSMLPDGRILFAGGHDKGGNNGIRKINVFNPATGSWLARPVPPVKADYRADPTGEEFEHADPLDEANTDPPNTDPRHASDMKYQRWYPTTVTLPDGKVLILSGTDQDTSQGPSNARFTKVRMAVPEVYDPATDRTVALENARKLFAMYPRAYVVQTGPGVNDWKVAVRAEIQPPMPEGDELGGYDPFDYNGNTYLLDVQAALRDPDVGSPGERHWTFVDRSQYAHDSAGGAALWALDGQGRARSQQVVTFGGDAGTGGVVAAVESIDFKAQRPRYRRHTDLVQPATQNQAVALPDGNVLVLGGARGRGTGITNSLWYQLFSPASGRVRRLLETTVARHDHATALLLPDATVIAMGGNRTDLLPPDRNPGLTASQLRNAGVPVAQIYRPPYLFRGPRPEILDAPAELSYGSRFDVRVSTLSPAIRSATLVRIGPVTHNWDWGNRAVRLVTEEVAAGALGRTVRVTAPALPGLAVPGHYMLFLVSEDGVPSVAAPVHFDVP